MTYHVGRVCENGHLCLRLGHPRLVGRCCVLPSRREAAGPPLPVTNFGRDPASAGSAVIIQSPSSVCSPPASCAVGFEAADAYRHRHFGHSNTVVELDRPEQQTTRTSRFAEEFVSVRAFGRTSMLENIYRRIDK